MAEALTNRLAAERGIDVRGISAGTEIGDRVNPIAAQVMAEIGVSLAGHVPKRLTQEMADSADRIVTMGCGVDAATCPARILIADDWGLDDPAGRPLEEVRAIRDQIQHKVEQILTEFDTNHKQA